MRILIVEDEAELCDTIAEGLELDGYAVDRCYDGKVAHELLAEGESLKEQASGGDFLI